MKTLIPVCSEVLNLISQNLYYIVPGFSGADMATLCREAALGPIRDMSFGDIENISADQVTCQKLSSIISPDFVCVCEQSYIRDCGGIVVMRLKIKRFWIHNRTPNQEAPLGALCCVLEQGTLTPQGTG